MSKLNGLTLDAILEAAEADAGIGFCTTCGVEHDGIEPDASRYTCESCGAPTVFGAEELLLTGGWDR